MRRIKAPAVVALLLATQLLTACSTTVRVNGTEVDSSVPFLSVLEEVWQNEQAGNEHAQLAEKTGCWLLRAPDSGELESKALCGPIRHLKDKEKPGVFDILEFDPTLVGENVTVDPESIGFGDTGVEPPAGLELYRPDGQEPAAPEEVAEPIPPTAEPGIVTAGDDEAIVNAESPKDGFILTPGRKLTVTKVGTVPSLPSTSTMPFYVPADGEEFLALTIISEEQQHRYGRRDLSPVLSVRSGSATSDLGDLPVGDPKTLVVSVPKDADAELVVTMAGLEQTLSIRTGERTSKTAAALYRSKTVFSISKEFDQTAREGDWAREHRLRFTDARLSAFDRVKGWAPEGQMWLYIAWDNRHERQVGNGRNIYIYPEFDEANSLRVSDLAGSSVKVISGLPVGNGVRSSSAEVLAQISESAEGIEVVYAPQGRFSIGGQAISGIDPESGTFTFDPLAFEVSFP